MTDTLPDVEGALRTWLRTQTTVTALVGQRIFFGVPKGATEATFPMIAISRIGGGDAPGDAPVDIALVQFDVWGSIDDSGNGRKAEATAVVNALRSTVRSVADTPLTADVDAFGIDVQSVIWLPDPANDRPRYTVTAEVTAISS